MRQKLHLTVKCILYCFTLTLFQLAQAQTFSAPELSFAYACASDNFNQFSAIISFDGNTFNSNNEFHIELSDANGNFTSPVILETVNGENFSFEFETSFSLPRDIGGDSYKIRVRSTSPALVSPSSNSFNAYFIPDVELVLNNYEDVTICGGGSTTISLNAEVAQSYIWYKNNEFYKEGDNNLRVTESGEYYAEANFGDCTGVLHSNIVIVNFGEEIEAAIEGETVVDACPGTTYTLKTVTDNEFLDYRWFKDGVELTGLAAYMPELQIEASNETYGVYHLVLTNEGGCEASSEEVTIREPNSDATVTTASPLENISLGDGSVVLRISTSTADPRVSWFRNDELVSNGNSLEYVANTPGIYHAKVSAPGSCLGVINSPEFKVYDPVSFLVTVNFDENYESCESTSTKIAIETLTANANNGFEQDVVPALYDRFDFNWNRNDINTNETGSFYTVQNYLENGTFILNVNFNEMNFSSNFLNVQLGLADVNLQTDTSTICSNNGTATLSITHYDQARYNWFKDGVLLTTGSNTLEVSESGSYYATIILGQCETVSNTLDIIPFGEDIISVFPSQNISIAPNSTEIVSASGGDSYQWTDENGSIVSTSDFLNILEAGTYYLTATKDGCEITKVIQVELLEVVEVPNIISPNQDNINDKWVLPAKFINDPDIEVTICDTYGNPILKTKSYQNNWPENSGAGRNEAAIYYYLIQKNGQSLKKGSITVVNR